LPNPRLQLNSPPAGQPTSNDDWHAAANAAELASSAAAVGAFPLNAGSGDAALLLDLPAGSRTLFVTDPAPAEGVALVEVYEVSAAPGQRLANISTRADVRTGSEVAIAGFVVGEGPVTVLVRAVGPTLASAPFNIAGTLPNPRLRLVQRIGGNDVEIASNDTWHASTQAAAITSTAAAVGAFPLLPASADAAVLVTLLPGSYTAVVEDAGGGSGIAILEVYEVR
jgi:hypothetical protein